MFVTFEVFQPDRLREVRLEHWPNILFMSVTLLVSKFDKSRVVRLRHP